MAKRVATLYLEDSNIRLLIARGEKVERWASIPLEPNLVNGGVIVDENQVASKIRELFITAQRVQFKTTGIKKITESVAELFRGKGKLIVGLSGRDSLYRILSLPPLPDALLTEAVRREAGRVLPVSLNELYLAYQRIPGGDSETRVFVAAFPRTATDTLLSTLRTAGLKPRVLDLAPLALCLSVNEPKSIIVDARLDGLNIIIMADRIPQVIRSLSLHSETKTVLENMPTIIEEFSRTIAFYNSSHPQDMLNSDVPVFVSGDLANEVDTWKSLVGGHDFNVTTLPSALVYPEGFPMGEFIVNSGLAAKELDLAKKPGNYSLVNMNALPASALPRSVNLWRIVVPIVAVAGIAGVVLMWQTWQNTKHNTATLQSQLAGIESQITSNSKSVNDLTTQNESTRTQIQALKDTAGVFTTKMSTLASARNLTDSDVHQIIALAPPTVVLSGVTYTGTGATVSGSAGAQGDILKYAQVLRDTGGYNVIVSSINFSSTVSDTGEVIGNFNFSFQIK